MNGLVSGADESALIGESYSLSPMQQGLLFHHLTSGEAGVDLEQIVFTLGESLDLATFRRAWESLVAHHEILRTHFRWDGLPEPIQVVAPAAQLDWRVEDWSGLDRQSSLGRFDDLIRIDRAEGLDLGRAPVMRVTIVRLAADDYRCIWSFHHMLFDGRVFPTLIEELFDAYRDICAGKAPRFETRPRYRDYVEWRETHEVGPARAYWRRALEGVRNPTPPPPSARPFEPPSDRPASSEVRQDLPEDVSQALRDLATANGFTLNTIIQGAWALLLARYSGEADVVFGATRAARRSANEGAESTIGLFINTLPVRARIDLDMPAVEWLQRLRAEQQESRPFEQLPLVDVQALTDVPPGTSLFDTVLIFDNEMLGPQLRRLGGPWATRDFVLKEQTGYTLTLYTYAEPAIVLQLGFDPRERSEIGVRRILANLHCILTGLATDAQRSLGALPFLSDQESNLVTVVWNRTETPFQRDACIHHLIETQVSKTPERVAVDAGGQSFSYAQLNARAELLAKRLRSLDVGRDTLVGIHVARSLDLAVSVLAVLKAGGAYVPLDPTYPRDRVRLMLESSHTDVVISQVSLVDSLPDTGATVICIDRDWPQIAAAAAEASAGGDSTSHRSDQLAYVIYTSGSTGKPKGVMVEHRNVINFFAGMDQRVEHDPAGVWLAVTSLSFDISVLELLWTLSHGFTIVLQTEPSAETAPQHKTPSFSLFFWGGDGREPDGYRFLLDASRFADAHDFEAVWTPERHFHHFGGMYPNPSVASAAVAAVTERVQVRSGSVVLPLHHPARVAEEWAVVDNISRGRVGLSVASGWMPNDFALAPANFESRRELLYESLETLRALWRGEAVTMPSGIGQSIAVQTLPRPVQPELPVWITSGGNVETFRRAGEVGANVLTHLLGQRIEEVAEKIRAYRDAWTAAGHGPGRGHVTLMLHTLVGESTDDVREIAREPMKQYLASSVDLVADIPWAWPDFNDRRQAEDLLASPLELTPEDREALLDHAFDRYFETSGLFGSPEACLDMVRKVRDIDVDEIACLIDYGISTDVALEHLKALDDLRRRSGQLSHEHSASAEVPGVESLVSLAERHAVTHFQCTPSMASMLLWDEAERGLFANMRTVLIGGEAFPGWLAEQLRAVTDARIVNMYGPTETTVWSSTEDVAAGPTTIPIGRPIANTQLYILDSAMNPVPIGVPGELYIGGDGVVRGYHERPDLTAERFVRDPFSPDPAARMYRTGDLARYLDDGRIDFLGRSDFQVKVRGHRIELGEIEAALIAIEGVREAVVVAREDVVGDKRLVGYVVLGPDAPGVALLRQRISEVLPDFMVPSHLIVLDELPHTPNQKVDRNALPSPMEAPVTTEHVAVPPSNALERMIAEVWREVLRIPTVGIHDNFFDLGGDSLLTIRVHGRLRPRVDREFAVVDLFRFPTVFQLAQHLGGGESGQRTVAQARGAMRREAAARRAH